MRNWNELSMAEKADVMKLAIEGGVYDLDSIRSGYNEYAKGGKIHIKPENRGKFTALKKRTGHSASWFKEHGTPAQKKMAVFALNARKWKHEDGGNLYDGTNEDSQQMNVNYGAPYYDYNLPDHPLTRNASSFPEVIITPDSKKSPAERAVLERERRGNNDVYYGNGTYNAKADREKTELEKIASEKAWNNSIKKQAMDYAQATATGIGIGADIVSGLPIYSSLKGARVLSEAETPMDYAEGALWLSPIGGIVGKETINTGKAVVNNVVDSGLLWDAYTTFGGRLGNYGDNMLTNIYGTAARRFGLPDKARIPADAMRKIKGDITIDNGLVDLTGNKSYLGKPHVNATLDRGVVSHSKGQWDGANTYITPTRNFVEQAQEALKSIEPSDMFSNGARITEVPQNVTLISGDVEALNKAREAGMQTLSSPKLRRIYNEGLNEYKVEKAMFDEQYANATGLQKRLLKAPESPKYRRWWPEYTKEMQRLQAQRGTPTLADFGLLEQQTGLKSGVAPMLEYNKAIRQLEAMKGASIHDIMSGKVQPYVYPNGRIVDWDKAAEELELIRRAKYNNVFYDPASYVESDWQVANGIK